MASDRGSEGTGDGPGTGVDSAPPASGGDDGLIARIVRDRRIVTEEQLRDCLEEQRRPRIDGPAPTLGEILVRRKWVRVDDLIRWVSDHRSAQAALPRVERYEIRDRIGEGASALVYRAWDRQLNRPVALKVLREIMVLSALARQRFQREAQAAAGISHPNVVTVHDAGEADGRPYLVMELVEGRPLNELLKEGRDERALLTLLEKVARGLEAAHAKGVVHRDLKPANILVTAAGEPKIGDFGLAHLIDSEADLTRAGTALGTPLYMSPEQVHGDSRAITPQTDVYALGAILYEAVLGVPPHVGDSIQEIYGKIQREEPRAPRKIDPKRSADLETVVLKALAKRPADRYATAGALADDLRRLLNGEPIAARPAPGTVRVWRQAVRHRVALASLTAALVGALAGAWAIPRLGHPPRPVAPPAERPATSPLAPGRPELDEAYYREFARAVPLLAQVVPARDRVSGEWREQGGRLSCGSAPFTRLQFATIPPSEYDLRVTFVRKSGYGDVNLLLTKEGRPFLWAMGAVGNSIFGFGTIKGAWADSNPTTRHEQNCVPIGQVFSVVVQVRRDGVWAYVNGKLKSSWATDYRDFGSDENWGLPDPRHIGLGTYESETEFRQVELLDVSGRNPP